MKHNFMTKMVSALLAVVLSTAAFSVTAFASGGEENTESVTEQETAGDVSDLLSALEGSQITVSVTEDGIQFSSGENDSGQTGTVTTDGGNLNVRTGAGMDYTAFTQLPNGTTVKVIGTDGDWLKVQYTDSKEGYVSAEYVTISEEFIYAKTIEEEQAEIAAQKALQAREQTAEQDAPEVITNITLPTTTYTSNAELRQGIIEYAMQYLGNRYVHGGSSLSGGTDCSGFTCFIYAEFGYSIRRTPGGQYSGAGRSISSEELQPGDIVCYSSNGGKSCTHVGLYIGDGQIIHSANSRKGVIISAVDYSPIIGMRNVID